MVPHRIAIAQRTVNAANSSQYAGSADAFLYWCDLPIGIGGTLVDLGAAGVHLGDRTTQDGYTVNVVARSRPHSGRVRPPAPAE